MAVNPQTGSDLRQFPRTAVDEFLFKQFQGKIQAKENRSTVGVAASIVLPNNPERVSFLLINTSAGTITVGFSEFVTNGSGIVLGPNGGWLRMSVLEDGGPCGWSLFGVGSGAGLTYYVLENIRYAARKEVT